MSAQLTDDEAAALGAVDEAALGELLCELVAVPSITGSAAESELQHLLAARLEQMGLDVDHWSMDLPALRAHPDFPGTEAPRTEAWGLVATTAGAAEGPTTILCGHVDVVPPGDRDAWNGDPFTPRVTGQGAARVVHGRGTCDMKAGVAANIAAVAALRASGATVAGPVALHLVVGEEDGGLGAFGTLARGHTGDACVITEPTSGALVTANGGALTFTLRVPGLAAHGATRYTGVSAIDAYLPLHAALSELERARNVVRDPLMDDYPVPCTLSLGTVHAGDWASTVPDLLVAQGRLGVRLGEDPAHARAELEQCVAQVCAENPWLSEHPATVAFTGGQFASGRLPSGHPLGARVSRAHAEVTGAGPPRERGGPYGSDLRLYAGAGIPTLQLGPGEFDHAHSPHEQVRLADAVAVARTLVLVALRNRAP